MPSQSYYNQGGEQAQNYQKNSPATFADLYPEESSIASIRERRLVRGAQAAKDAYSRIPEKHQKEFQNKLENLQRGAPALAAGLAAAKPSAFVGLAKDMWSQIRWSTDWLFMILISFALLKDIFDMVFAAAATATSWIPILGEVNAAMGIIFTFVGELMLLILTVTVLILTGSSWKNRGMAKYFMWVPIAFISEALPGIGWLPLAFIEAIILYGFVLFDRTYEAQSAPASQNREENMPAYAAADNYYEPEEQMAA